MSQFFRHLGYVVWGGDEQHPSASGGSYATDPPSHVHSIAAHRTTTLQARDARRAGAPARSRRWSTAGQHDRGPARSGEPERAADRVGTGARTVRRGRT